MFAQGGLRSGFFDTKTEGQDQTLAVPMDAPPGSTDNDIIPADALAEMLSARGSESEKFLPSTTMDLDASTQMAKTDDHNVPVDAPSTVEPEPRNTTVPDGGALTIAYAVRLAIKPYDRGVHFSSSMRNHPA